MDTTLLMRFDNLKAEREGGLSYLNKGQDTLGHDAGANEEEAKRVQGALLAGLSGNFESNVPDDCLLSFLPRSEASACS